MMVLQGIRDKISEVIRSYPGAFLFLSFFKLFGIHLIDVSQLNTTKKFYQFFLRFNRVEYILGTRCFRS